MSDIDDKAERFAKTKHSIRGSWIIAGVCLSAALALALVCR